MTIKSAVLLSGRNFEIAGMERLMLETLKDSRCKNLWEGKPHIADNCLHHVSTSQCEIVLVEAKNISSTEG